MADFEDRKVDLGRTLTPVPALANNNDWEEKASVGSSEDLKAELELSPEERRAERRFLWKLDLVYCLVAMIAFIFKIVDQYNIQNAYVSGMKEDLNLHGNEYNWFTTYFNIGYVVVLYPSAIAVSYFGPHWLLPSCELVWGVLTCCLSVVNDAKTVYGIRFLIGFAEGTAWPGNTTILSQWYLPNEIGTRLALFNVAQPIGAMISGVMQGALSETLDGKLGRAGWRWAFIINGVVTIFIALVTYFTQPGMPEKPNPLARWYLSDADIAIARRRVARVGRKPQVPLTVKSFFSAFRYWQLWAIALCWAFGYNTVPSNYFNLWLKSLTNADGSSRFSVPQLSYIPMGGQAVCLVTLIALLGLSDYLGVRLPSLALHTCINLISQVILVVRPKNEATYAAGFFLNYAGLPGYLLVCAWAATYMNDLPQVRAVLYATGTLISYLLVAFVPLWAFPAKDAPHWAVGAKFYLGSMCFAFCLFLATAWGLRWEERKKLRQQGRIVPKQHCLAWLWT